MNARTHNLRSVNLDIPHNSLTVLTGVSGSGKSSLAIDTLFAEGQRQYIDSLSTYARQFLDQMSRPDVELIEGIQPTLCIDQQVASANPRSTVATVTEVYDYLRLLMARVGTPTCYECGQVIEPQSADRIQSDLRSLPEGTRLILMAPVVRGRRGAHRETINAIRQAGLVRLRVDGEMYDIDAVPELAVRKNHSIEAVVDKLIVRPDCEDRLSESIGVALRLSGGLVSARFQVPPSKVDEVPSMKVSEAGPGRYRLSHSATDEDWQDKLYSTLFACPSCGVSYAEVEPRTFSFNSPYGACSECDGVGTQSLPDPDALVPDWSLTPASGAFSFLQGARGTVKRRLTDIAKQELAAVGVNWRDPLSILTRAKRRALVAGSSAQAGIAVRLEQLLSDGNAAVVKQLQPFLRALPCPACGGARLRKEALAVKLDGKHIHELCSLNIESALEWLESRQFPPDKQPVAAPIMTEMLHRFRFLVDVGVGYLSLARSAESLSGGELQRVRLATSIGSGLVGVCYILDEPSIGLHQCDNDRLIESLRQLQQQGNTVIVVEHDESMMRAADLLVDIGPGAGTRGGKVVCQGTPDEVEAHPDSITAGYLRGALSVERTSEVRVPSKSKWIRLKGAALHNLRDVDLAIPVGLLVGITGVSGSGKSSLIGETLIPALANAIGQAATTGGPFRALSGQQHIDKLIEMNQKPIGRTPRSTPATYCGAFDLIRAVWANTREAKRSGFTSRRFSFNTGEGRCSQCQGQGQEKIEMNFLPDLFVTCSACSGRRFNRQTLQVRYREKSIADALDMTFDDALEFFANFSKIHHILRRVEQVGLGYLRLGQSSTTLSGGEAQRIKLATELCRAETGRTIYFLDEPTTGLHFEDVRRLVDVLDGLVRAGNSVIIIEHNLDVIRCCDWLIDLGPGGGDAGGRVVATGSPRQVSQEPNSLTGRYLQPYFEPR